MALGIILGFATALGISWHAYTLKQLPKIDTFVLSFFKTVSALFVIALLIQFTSFGEWIFPITRQFWTLIGAIVFIEILITYAFTRSHQISDQSLVGPLFAISPIFLLPAGVLFLGDSFNIYSIIGVVLVFTGSITASWSQGGNTILGSFKIIRNDKGAVWMIFAALLAAIAVSITKYSLNTGIPFLALGFYVLLGQSLVVLPLAVRGYIKNEHTNISIVGIWIAGFSFGIMQTLHYAGISLLPAAYFISIKRLSIISDVLIGSFFEKENQWFKSRLIGAAVMLCGVLIFLLFGSN